MCLARRVPLASRATEDRKAFLATREKKERPVAMAPGAPRENGGKWACLASLESTEYRAYRDLQAQGESLALTAATEQRETPVRLVHWALTVRLAIPVHRAPLDPEESPPTDHQEPREKRETRDEMAKLDLPECLERTVLLDRRVTLDPKDPRDFAETTVQLDPRATWASASRGARENPARKVQWVPGGRPATAASRVTRFPTASLAHLERGVSRAARANQE